MVRVPKAYPAYFGSYSEIGHVRAWLDSFTNLFPVGRNGMHRYNNQDHSMLAAKAAVECIAGGSTDKASLWSVNVEDEYHETRAPTRVNWTHVSPLHDASSHLKTRPRIQRRKWGYEQADSTL